jgi:signal peptidase
VLYSIGVGLSAGLLGLIVLLGLAVVGIPAIVGATPLTVLTQSMIPTYPPGTLVIVRPTATQDIRIGDAMTYQIESGRPEVVTHRVIAIERTTNGSTTFTTQGDNNSAPDPKPVTTAQVKGTVWYAVPYIGYVNSTIGGADKGWLIPVIAVALFLYAGWMFASGLSARSRKRRRERRRRASAVAIEPMDS